MNTQSEGASTPENRTLAGHVSQETAYVVDDYPYGFKLRCKIRYWIETKRGFGQRAMSQTTNPKIAGREVWNTPKNMTVYKPLVVLYVAAQTGHVESEGLSQYAREPERKAFLERHASALTSDYEKRMVALYRGTLTV